MTEKINPPKNMPADWAAPVEKSQDADLLKGQHARMQKIAKIVFYLLASSAAFAAAAKICFLLTPALGPVFVIGSVALAALGIAVGLNCIADRLPKPLRKTVQLVHAVVTETFAVVLVGLLYPLKGFFQKKITPAAQDERPVLLVHGYLHNSTAWVYMMDELQKAGFKSIYTISLWHPFRSIPDYAAQVQEKAKKIAEETNQKNLIFIGHSMGGLVVSAAALTMTDEEVTVTDVITLGSPLKGTPLAKIGLGLNARQMERNSDFVQALGARILKNEKNIRFFEAASSMDEIVPGKYALLGQKGRQLVLNDIGHVGLLFSQRVANWIVRSLSSSE